MTTGEKILAWGAAGITAVLVTFGIIEAVKSKPAASNTPAATGTTMSILLTTPSGGGTGNLGIVALPAGATLIVGSPQGGSVGNVSFSAAGYKVAAQTGTAVSIQASSTTPAVAQATITWVDATNAAQSSTVQIVPELATTQIALFAGQMPDMWLPASSSSVTGALLFCSGLGRHAAAGYQQRIGNLGHERYRHTVSACDRIAWRIVRRGRGSQRNIDGLDRVDGWHGRLANEHVRGDRAGRLIRPAPRLAVASAPWKPRPRRCSGDSASSRQALSFSASSRRPRRRRPPEGAAAVAIRRALPARRPPRL